MKIFFQICGTNCVSRIRHSARTPAHKRGGMEIHMKLVSADSPQEYMDLQRYALGNLMFWLSGIRLAA